MRQLKRSRLKDYYIRPRSVKKDDEGVPSEVFGSAFPVRGEIWPATSTRQIETYGDRIKNISNMRIVSRFTLQLLNNVPVLILPGDLLIRPGDGLCVLAGPEDLPDFRVLSITPYEPVKLEIERR